MVGSDGAGVQPRTEAGACGAAMTELPQSWPRPSRPRPIVIIGTGAIVQTAHLPAYRRLGFPIAGVFDVRPHAASEVASRFEVPTVFDTLAHACATRDAV